MNSILDTRTPSRFLLIPLLYLAIAGLMLFLQFGNAMPFTDSWESLEISGRRITESGERGISDLKLEHNDFILVFGTQQPIISTTNNVQTRHQVSGYTKYPDRLEIRFTDNLKLSLTTGPKTTLAVKAEYQESRPQNLQMQFQLRNPQQFRTTAGFPVLQRIGQTDSETSFIRLPAASSINMNSGLMEIAPDGQQPILTMESSTASSIIAYWFSRQKLEISESAINRSINNYINRAWNGWRSGRFNPGSVSWQGNASTTFSEDLLNAYGSESYRRNDFSFFLSRIIPQITNRETLGYLSNPFSGNIVSSHDSLVSDIQKAENIAQSAAISSIADAVLLTRFKEILPRQRMAILKTRLEDGLNTRPIADPATRTILLYCYIRLLPEAAREPLIRIIEELLLARLQVYRDGYLFETANGVSDSQTGILAALVLMETGQNELYVKIGRQLLNTYLDMADASGRLPRELVRGESTWSASREFLFPEEIYVFLTDSRFHPAVHRINDSIWAWGAASELSGFSRGNQLVITSTAQTGSVLHLTLTGIEPFTSVSLFGIQWNSDPQFQRYSSGWVYDNRNKTLFVKITHRRATEQVVIDYSPPAPRQETDPADEDPESI